jgi:NtrC-family two-component system response regulator AlgB
LEPQDLGLEARSEEIANETATNGPGTWRSATPILGEEFSLAEVEREHIARVVARAPSFEAAAQILGIDPTTLQRRRKRYGLA